ncbi:MAG: hypothetical protein LBC52_06835 [Treponema sp.]|jgi:hypothetical protein|nr:hypothetical protein [Treponema sp.]
MLIFEESSLNEGQIPEIRETEEEKQLTVAVLKKKYIAFARSRFIHNPPMTVLNRDTNWLIELSNRVINEWWGKSRTRERILSIQLLDVMIEGAKFLKTVDDTKKTPGIENVSYFENLCKINGKLFRINITVKKMLDKNRRFAYYYAATNFEAQ